jgi:hypothetical protein
MADIRGVGKPITYSDEGSPIEEFMQNLKREWAARRREPRDQAERELLGRWLGYRGREELECIVGSAAYAYAHFAGEMDSEWRYILADHIGTEAGHGWGYIRQASLIDPSRDHTQPDPEFQQQYGVYPSQTHAALMRRDFLSYLFAGNMWPYGHCTAATIQCIAITMPKVLDFETRVVEAEERGHHDAALQKIHDYVWQLIDRYGEGYVRQRIAEIDAAALNSGSRITFDPPRRDFLQKYFQVPIENTSQFLAWREYLYLNVLGFPPEPVHIKTWPKEVPQPSIVAA